MPQSFWGDHSLLQQGAIADFDKGKIELRMGSSKLEIPIPNLKRIS